MNANRCPLPQDASGEGLAEGDQAVSNSLFERDNWFVAHSGWRHIETAPRNGKLILAVAYYNDGLPEYVLIHWVGGEWREAPFDHVLTGTGDESDDKVPMYWMPLLPAPEMQTKG